MLTFMMLTRMMTMLMLVRVKRIMIQVSATLDMLRTTKVWGNSHVDDV